ncbi:PCI domain containing 2 [Planoprotostelium fungivorum]|uniref:PCI domain containing 2 n=1 Tax=Planoprotostelium fungivorum TaxID=1890364 RepID=A0A2P6N1V5_9EUKA|nr:PCI domain containing 2 [Planoprotostelium fungivorum]
MAGLNVRVKRDLAAYIVQLERSINVGDGDLLASLLRKNSLSKFQNKNQVLLNLESQIDSVRTEVIEDNIIGHLQPPYDRVASEHLKAIICLKKSNYVEAYVHQAQVVTDFLEIWKEPPKPGDYNSALNTVSVDLRLIGRLADRELNGKGQMEDKCQDAGRLLMNVFSACNQSRDESKKQCLLSIVNSLFKIYFQLGTLRLCKNLIKTVENKGSLPINSYTIAQRVTYKFYTGRLNMSNSRFKQAETDLDFAFKKCTVKSKKNKRQILLYLIPAKILVGKLPRSTLLKTYNLVQFEEISKAVCTGDLRSFTVAMDAYHSFFIRKGTFLIMELSKTLVYRSFIKKITNIVKDTKIPLSKIKRLLTSLGIEMDIGEIECVLANLIFSGYIRGYVSHFHSTLVVAGSGPFPPIINITGKNEE